MTKDFVLHPLAATRTTRQIPDFFFSSILRVVLPRNEANLARCVRQIEAQVKDKRRHVT